MIRICYVVDAAFLGGAEWYVSRLATALDRTRFEAAVLLRTPDDDGGLDGWAAALSANGVPVTRIPMNLPFRPQHAPGILAALQRVSPHVVHVNMPGPYNGQTGLMVPLARMSGARVMVTEHLPMISPPWKRAALKALAYRWLDVGLTVSVANAAFLTRLQGVPATRVRVVHNGVADAPRDPALRAALRAQLEIGADEVAVVFAGNLLAYKGLQELIHALSEMSRAPWTLLVIGDGPDRHAAAEKADAAGIRGRIRFLGRRPPDETRALLSAGDVLALPSAQEGLPYVVLEAMAAALPVVSTRVFGIPEAVVHDGTGLLVEPGDTPALRSALVRLVSDAGLRQRMGSAGRDRYEAMFTLAAQVAATSAIYRELATGRRDA
ncbi:MAG TPA: glycosyltransferase family 4 protein [Candidatus Krumholzibacteria bacterium]|nr:glycosyltransferase family 4 protein [Candidatus Krumholzibacteria bacterium]